MIFGIHYKLIPKNRKHDDQVFQYENERYRFFPPQFMSKFASDLLVASKHDRFIQKPEKI